MDLYSSETVRSRRSRYSYPRNLSENPIRTLRHSISFLALLGACLALAVPRVAAQPKLPFSAAGFLGGAGALAANMLTEQANLGTTPRNRLHVVFWKQGVKHRMLFDVRDGKSAADLEDRCLAFWRQTAASRSQFAKAPGAPADED